MTAAAGVCIDPLGHGPRLVSRQIIRNQVNLSAGRLRRDHAIEKIVVDGDKAFVTYSSSTSPGQRFRNTEVFTFCGERIARVDVYFGAAYQNGVLV